MLLKSRSSVTRILFSAQRRFAIASSSAPESDSSQTVSASKPCSRKIEAVSTGRFSSTLNFTHSARAEDRLCSRGPIRLHTLEPHQYRMASVKDSSQEFLNDPLLPRYCREQRIPSLWFLGCMLSLGKHEDLR